MGPSKSKVTLQGGLQQGMWILSSRAGGRGAELGVGITQMGSNLGPCQPQLPHLENGGDASQALGQLEDERKQSVLQSENQGGGGWFSSSVQMADSSFTVFGSIRACNWGLIQEGAACGGFKPHSCFLQTCLTLRLCPGRPCWLPGSCALTSAFYFISIFRPGASIFELECCL